MNTEMNTNHIDMISIRLIKMASMKRKLDDMDQGEIYELFNEEVFPNMGHQEWTIMMILVLAAKFNSLCLFVPSILSEDRKFVNHPTFVKHYDYYDKNNYQKLTGEGNSEVSYDIEEFALEWNIVEKVNREGKRELTGILLLPEILQDSFENFYNAMIKCLEIQFSRKVENKKLPIPKWVKIPGINPEDLEDEDRAEYEYYKSMFNQKDSIDSDSKSNQQSKKEIEIEEDVEEDVEAEEDDKGDEDIYNTDSKRSKREIEVEDDEDDEDDEDIYNTDDEDEDQEEFDRIYDNGSILEEVDEVPFRKTPPQESAFIDHKGPRYIIMPLIITYTKAKRRSQKPSSSHAAVLIFDRQEALLRHFDPNGNTNLSYYLEDEMIRQIRNAFQGFYKNLVYPECKNTLAIVRSSYVCELGPQMKLEIGKGKYSKRLLTYMEKTFSSSKYEQKEEEYEKIMSETCTVWSFIFMYLTLYYPDADTDEIMELMSEPEPEELEDILFEVVTDLAQLSKYIMNHDLSYEEIIDVILDGIENDNVFDIENLFDEI